jgi:hypothetical protein
MKILFYQDGTLELNLNGLLSGPSAIANDNLTLREGNAQFRIVGEAIRYSSAYDQL